MTLEIEVRSSGLDGVWAAFWGRRRPSAVAEMVAQSVASVSRRAPMSGVAVVIRRAP